MDRVVAPDGKRIPVTGGHPDFQVRARDLQPRGDSRRAAVNRVKAKRIHVVGKAARATDARNYDKLLLRDSEVRENCLYRGKNCVVTTARAPANFLVGLKIFLR